MSHKRYQNPNKGYSRRQQRELAEFSIEAELMLAEQVDPGRFGPESITALMARGADEPRPAQPAVVVDEPSPSTALADLMHRASPPAARMESSPDRGQGHPPATRVIRGSTSAPAATNARIERLDRLLDAIRKAR